MINYSSHDPKILIFVFFLSFWFSETTNLYKNKSYVDFIKANKNALLSFIIFSSIVISNNPQSQFDILVGLHYGTGFNLITKILTEQDLKGAEELKMKDFKLTERGLYRSILPLINLVGSGFVYFYSDQIEQIYGLSACVLCLVTLLYNQKITSFISALFINFYCLLATKISQNKLNINYIMVIEEKVLEKYNTKILLTNNFLDRIFHKRI